MTLQEDRLSLHETKALETQQLILEQLQTNTLITQQVAADTAGIRELWSQSIGALGLFNKIMWLVKRMLWVGVGIIFVFWIIPYMMVHNGEVPVWFKSLKSLLL